MVAESELAEYLEEIRKEVCSRCVERPPGGPPCGPLGKQCGIEMHLPKLIESIHEVKSDLIAPYLDHNRRTICEHCPLLHSSTCPCPMDYLAVLLVEAVEKVDRRREQRGKGRLLVAGLPGEEDPDLAEVCRVYEEAAGTWIGCDWPTAADRGGLDLNGWTAGEAECMAVEVAGIAAREEWAAAARWLADIERCARQAEAQAAMAMTAANAGLWEEAAEHARRAWALEFVTGRPFRRQAPPAWLRLCQVVRSIAETAATLTAGEPVPN